MTVGLYVRVSTDEQAEHGTSIDVQKDRLASFAKSQGWDEFSFYIDDGYTGTNTERPALKKMMRHCENGKLKTVVVYKLDRLGRKQKDVLHLLEDVFEKNNVSFKSATEPFDTSTPLGKAMLGILAVFAQLERDMIIERTTSGRRHRTSKGIWYGGRVAFGYEWIDGQLIVIPEEARIVKEVYSRYLNGHSRLSIAEWAASRSKARVFDHTTIRDMLGRSLYMGKLINNGELVNGNHEAIIDEYTWYAVQQETSKRANDSAPIGEYLLTGLLECGECGSNIVHVKRKTSSNKKTYLYELYACRNQHVREKDRAVPCCNLGYIRRAKLEDIVVAAIKEFGLNPESLTVHKDIDNEETINTSLKNQLLKINQSLENLYDAIESGEIKPSRISGRISKLEEEREALELQLEELEMTNVEVDPKQTLQAIKQISEAWSILDHEEQKILVRMVVKKVTLYKDKTQVIHWNV